MKYWLYTEPYTFFFLKGEYAALYNTLDKRILKIHLPESISPILTKLAKEKCIEITDQEFINVDLTQFIHDLRTSYNGDLIESTGEGTKPALFRPIINNQRDFERLKSTNWENINSIMIDYLDEVYLYLNGFGEVGLHNTTYLQVPSYIHSKQSIPIKDLKYFLDQVPDGHIDQLNLLGGDILEYESWDEMIDLCNKKASAVNLHIVYSFFKKDIIKQYENKLSKTTLLIPVNKLDTKILEKVESGLSDLNIDIKWHFLVTTEEECLIVENIVTKLNLRKYKITPIFTGDNFHFFESSVFITEEDLEAMKSSKSDIYANQSINKNDFGRLTILPNGSIFANVNHPSLGEIGKSTLTELIYKELTSTSDKSWLKVRKESPCCDCIYQWLCPSPSSFELVFGKPNLCHINHNGNNHPR